jgi:hypothetical protein
MKMGGLGLLLLAWVLLGIANAEAAAEEPAGSILFENDLFYNADHDYTNGTELSYTTAPKESPSWAHGAAHLLPFFSDDDNGTSVRTRFALGQAMFTPTDITLINPPLNDRPYAAFFFGSIGVVGEKTNPDNRGGHLDQVQLTLGAVGPMAVGEEIQKFIHGIVHARKPAGWHYQLRDEPGLVLQYERTWKLVEHDPSQDVQYDIEPHFGGAIGNVWDYVNAGAMARIGFNLPTDYGPMRIQPSLPGSDYFEPGTKGWLGAYIFAGIEGRAVARNLFLDGNSFESSRSVSKLNLVGDLVLGAAVTFDCARLAFTHVIRTREYKTQGGDDQYGAVDLTLRL